MNKVTETIMQYIYNPKYYPARIIVLVSHFRQGREIINICCKQMKEINILKFFHATQLRISLKDNPYQHYVKTVINNKEPVQLVGYQGDHLFFIIIPSLTDKQRQVLSVYSNVLFMTGGEDERKEG